MHVERRPLVQAAVHGRQVRKYSNVFLPVRPCSVRPSSVRSHSEVTPCYLPPVVSSRNMQMQSALGGRGASNSFHKPYISAQPPYSRLYARPPSVLTTKAGVARYYGRRHSQLTVQAHRTPENTAYTHKRQGQRGALHALTIFGLPPHKFTLFCRHSACACFATTESRQKEDRTACCGCGIVYSHACQLSLSRSQ